MRQERMEQEAKEQELDTHFEVGVPLISKVASAAVQQSWARDRTQPCLRHEPFAQRPV